MVEVQFKADNIYLAHGTYKLNIGISDERRSIQFLENCITMHVEERTISRDIALLQHSSSGFVLNQMSTTIQKIT
jgi:hypothetical protein